MSNEKRDASLEETTSKYPATKSQSAPPFDSWDAPNTGETGIGTVKDNDAFQIAEELIH